MNHLHLECGKVDGKGNIKIHEVVNDPSVGYVATCKGTHMQIT